MSQESVGEILAVKNGQKKSQPQPVPIVGTPESISFPTTTKQTLPITTPETVTQAVPLANMVPKTAPPQALAQGNMVPVQTPPLANMLPKIAPPQAPVLNNMAPQTGPLQTAPFANMVPKKQPPNAPQLNMAVNNPPVSFQGNTLAKMFPKPLIKAYNRGVPVTRNPFQRNQQAAKMRYLNTLRRKTFPRMQYAGYVSDIQNQNARYTTNYNPRRPMYPYQNKMNFRPNLRRMGQVGVKPNPIPGSMRPGKVITMSQKAPYTNPASKLARLPKAPAFKFVAVGKAQEARTQLTSSKVKPIKKENYLLPSVLSGSGSGEVSASGNKEPKVIDPKAAVYSTGGNLYLYFKDI